MFTSRAEYRLQLREDNADMRLTETGRRLGLIDDGRWEAFNRKRDAVAREVERLKSVWVRPDILSGRMPSGCSARPSTRILPGGSDAAPGIGYDTVVAEAQACEARLFHVKHCGRIGRAAGDA
jgi:tRNA uridine 5-carboxymethylaminomethyl modification enzyme